MALVLRRRLVRVLGAAIALLRRLSHVLAAVHPAVTVAILAATVIHGMALMLAALLSLALLASLMLRMVGMALHLLMTLMLGLGSRRGLGRGGESEGERHRNSNNLHRKSPERSNVKRIANVRRIGAAAARIPG
jgi:hypothetical protein